MQIIPRNHITPGTPSTVSRVHRLYATLRKQDMFIRALIAVLILPGVVAGLVPFVLYHSDPWRTSGFSFGSLLMVAGLCILLWCSRDFYTSGKGTLAPWFPPQRLVVVGLYRICRNPMYIGVLILVAGWAVYSGSPLTAGYLVILIPGFHLRVILFEEPRLLQLFGPEWRAYASTVPRWLPRFELFKKTSDTS